MLDIKPLVDKDDLTQLYVNAREEGHMPLYPTHIVKKDERISGFLSIARMPIFYMWMSKECSKFDSFKALKVGESLMIKQGCFSSLVLCASNSPYHEYLPRLGYRDLGKTTMNLKNF